MIRARRGRRRPVVSKIDFSFLFILFKSIFKRRDAPEESLIYILSFYFIIYFSLTQNLDLVIINSMLSLT